MAHGKASVAVVGGGPSGLAALKELRGLGFDVTLFERRDDVGGIWTWTQDRSVTTALKETRICNSKFHLPFSDFPMPSEYPPIISSSQMGTYLRSYAKHFDLYPNIQFGKTVTGFERGKGPAKWQLTFADKPNAPKAFDKVVWATGPFLNPKPVKIEGQESFAGRVLHSQEVRNLDEFAGQTVLVLGIGNTAADIAAGLAPLANRVYLSHRRGAKMIKTSDKYGVPGDLAQSSTVNSVIWFLEAYLPAVYGKIMDSVVDGSFKQNWGVNDPAWGFSGSPSIRQGLHTIVCNDYIVPLVKEGKIISTPGLKRITGPKTVELDSGLEIEGLDAIIACIGYSDDLDMLAGTLTFVDGPEGAKPLASLYQGVFPPEDADSLCFLSNVHLNGAQLPGRELAAMAVGQVWAGKSSLPSPSAMSDWVRLHQKWLYKRIETAHGAYRGDVLAWYWMRFMHETAGTGLYDHVGWSWKAWKLWWTDSELYRALAYGPATPHANRLFETGKRPAWEPARQAILDVNAEAKDLKARLTKPGAAVKFAQAAEVNSL